MNKSICSLVVVLLLQVTIGYSQKQISQDERMAWWRDARFGMFIHWGPVTLKGTEIGLSRGGEVPIAEYDTLYKHFNPDSFNADEWVNVAKAAGMKYIVLTTKHVDGFCLWNTRQTDYNIMNTPFKRDVVKELAEACKKQGMPFGAYYSTCDWYHPDFPLTGYLGSVRRPQSDLNAYTGYLKRQVAELLLNYGPLAVLWFDVPQEFDAARGQGVIDFVRSIQPSVIVNNRTGAKGDFHTPEQAIPAIVTPGVDWEACMTMNEFWAYNPNDNKWKNASVLLRNLIDIASKGGNYLLNVGPDSHGVIPGKAVERLKAMGQWLATNGESVYGTTAGPFHFLPWGRVTCKGQTLYLHVFEYPKDGKLIVPLSNTITKAYLLSEPQTAIKMKKGEDNYTFQLPKQCPDTISTVIAVHFEGEISVLPIPTVGKKIMVSSTDSTSKASFLNDGDPKTKWVAPKGVKSVSIEIDLETPTAIYGISLTEPWNPWENVTQNFELQYWQNSQWITVCKNTTQGIGLNLGFNSVIAQKFRLILQNEKRQLSLNEFILYGLQ